MFLILSLDDLEICQCIVLSIMWPPTYSRLPCAGPPWPLRRGPGVLRSAHSLGGGGTLSVCLSQDP